MGLEGPADPLVGLLGPVLGMLLGAGLSVSRDVGGEISSEFAPCAFERSPPHLFLYLFLFNKRTKGGNNLGLCRLQTPGSLKFY